MNEKFESDLLSRVSRPCDDDVYSIQGAHDELRSLQAFQFGPEIIVGQFKKDVQRFGTLKGDIYSPVLAAGRILQIAYQYAGRYFYRRIIPVKYIIIGIYRIYPVPYLVRVGGVHHHHEIINAPPVNEYVVQHVSVGSQDIGVLGLARDYPSCVVRGDHIDEIHRVFAGEFQYAHVRDIEKAGGRSDDPVLFRDALVQHRHLPASEGYYTATQLHVFFIQGRSLQLFFGRLPFPFFFIRIKSRMCNDFPATNVVGFRELEAVSVNIVHLAAAYLVHVIWQPGPFPCHVQ